MDSYIWLMQPLLSLLAAADYLSASVKWTVNIDRETARGDRRPCQREKEREMKGLGGWGGGGGEMDRRTEGEGWRERSCLLLRQLSVL